MSSLSQRPLSLLLLCTIGVLIAACSGPPQATDDARRGGPAAGGPDGSDARRTSLAAVETFDVSQYPTPPPAREVDVQHQVPERLMQGQADKGVTQTVEGFRIQVYSAQDKQSADEFREQVRQWWANAQEDVPDDVFGRSLPIVVEYGQPYYRVRIGAFATRDEASDALSFVQREFTDAFVARSTVTITR